MTLVDLAFLVCLLAPILTAILLWFAFRKQRMTVAAQRRIDMTDRGPTLFLGNPRPQAKQSAKEWEEYQKDVDEFQRTGRRRKWTQVIYNRKWTRTRERTPPLGPAPWEMGEDKDVK